VECKKWLVRDHLAKVYEAKIEQLLQWVSSRAESLHQHATAVSKGSPSGSTEGLFRPTNDEKRTKLTEWSQVILAYRSVQLHCSASKLRPYIPPMGKTLSFLEEAWLSLEKATHECTKTIQTTQLVKPVLEKKLSHKVERLLQMFNDAQGDLPTVNSTAGIVKVDAVANRISDNIQQTLQFADVQNRIGGDMSQWKNRLLDLRSKVKCLKGDIERRRQLIATRSAPQLIQKTAALVQYLQDVKVSALEVNKAVNFDGAHSILQNMRYQQFSSEVHAYGPLVRRVVENVNECCASSLYPSEGSVNKHLVQSALDVEAAYNSLQGLRAEMKSTVDRTSLTEEEDLKQLSDECFETMNQEWSERLRRSHPTDDVSSSEDEISPNVVINCVGQDTLMVDTETSHISDIHTVLEIGDSTNPGNVDHDPENVDLIKNAESNSSLSHSNLTVCESSNSHSHPSLGHPFDNSKSDNVINELHADHGDYSPSGEDLHTETHNHDITDIVPQIDTSDSHYQQPPISGTDNLQISLTSSDIHTEVQSLLPVPVHTSPSFPDDKYSQPAESCMENIGEFKEMSLVAQTLVDDVISSATRRSITSGVCEDQVQANTSQPEVAHFPLPVSTDAVFDASHIPVVLQMESQWVSEQQSKLQTMKKDRLSLETKEDFGNGAFALLQRHHFLKGETSIHFTRVSSLKRAGELGRHSRMFEVDLVHSELVVLSQHLNKEVSSLLQLLDAFELSIALDLALQWFSEQEHIVRELDAPGGSIDVAHQLHYIEGIVSEADELYKSLDIPKDDGRDSIKVATTFMPSGKVSLVVEMYNLLSTLMQDRISLLCETLKVSSFSEWADVFAVWLVEKKNKLNRFRIPHSVEIAEGYLVHFKNCVATTLTVAKTSVDEWEVRVQDMVENCPTFSRGVHHIYVTLRNDYEEYAERLNSLLSGQELQLSIRYHLFAIEDLTKDVKVCLEREVESSDELSELQVSLRLLRTSAEQNSLEKQYTSIQRKTVELIDVTPPHEVGRTFLQSDQKQLDSIWSKYMGLYSSEKERNLKFLGYFKLSTRADVTVSSVEFLLVIMDEPYDESSEYSLRRAIIQHKEAVSTISTVAVETRILLKDASMMWRGLVYYKPSREMITPIFLKLRELWSEVRLFWETRKQELTDSYQALRSEVLVQHAEQLLTEMDLNSLLPEESTDDSGTVDRALSLVETALAAKQDVVQQLGKPVKEEIDVFEDITLDTPSEADFEFLRWKPHELATFEPEDRFAVCKDGDLVNKPAMPKGILKRPKLLTVRPEVELNESDKYLASSPVKETRSMQSQYMEQVSEEEVVRVVLQDSHFKVQWEDVFGSAIFADSPILSSIVRERSFRRNEALISSPAVIERSHAVLLPDRGSNFPDRVEYLLKSEASDDDNDRKTVKFSPVDPEPYFYPPEYEAMLDEEVLSLDSFENAGSGFEDTHQAMENLFHVVSEQRGKGSIWSWRNTKKTQPSKAQQGNDNTVHHVLHTENVNQDLFPPDENPEDPSLLQDEMLYSVGSLSSIIERYEGRLFRKHVMETWNKKASRRSWKLFHTVVYQGQIAFYKDAKHALMGRDTSASSLFLRGARCDVAHDYTKRPHVFRVTLGSGAQYLFEANNYIELDEWVQNINSQISQDSSSLSLPTQTGSPPPSYHGRGKRGSKKQKWNV
jgi:hypothetical protein